MSREEAKAAVEAHGGKTSDSISKTTNYLVAGDFSALSMVNDGKSGKLRKAESLAAEGVPIQIIAPEDFLKMIDG